jgi:branched-chain amino acid transport system permease protein
MAIREDELAATCMGINATKVKLIAFALGAAIAGLAGCVYAARLQNAPGSESFQFSLSITALCFLILGGLGNCYGAILGAFLIQGLEEIASPLMNKLAQKTFAESSSVFVSFSNWRFFIFGLALILMMRFRPEGLLPSKQLKEELHGEDAA